MNVNFFIGDTTFVTIVYALVIPGFGLDPPSFISNWTLMDSLDPATTKLTINHGLGVLPAMVEVQVKSEATGYIYPGVRSAYSSNVSTPRGGVVYNYDETNVRLYGATDCGQPAYIIYTGTSSWTNSDYQEINTTGLVRVRVWAPSNLPTNNDLGFVNVTVMHAGRSDESNPVMYLEMAHNFDHYPVLSVVQYTPLNSSHKLFGWYAEAQGSSSRPAGNPDAIWGGLVYAVNQTHIRLWAPSTTEPNASLYSFCGGWGGLYQENCSFDEAMVTIKLWRKIGPGLTFNYTQFNHHVTIDPYPYHNYTVFPLFMFSMDTDIINGGVVATSDVNTGYEFPGAGAAMMNDGAGCGGLVFGYTDYMLSLRFFHPTGADTYMVYMNGLADGENTQNTPIADLRVRIMTVTNTPADYCLEQFMPYYPGNNLTNETQTFVSSSPGCIVTYQCLSGYQLISGGLTLFYHQTSKTWNDSAPVCGVGSNSTTTAPITSTVPTPQCFCFDNTSNMSLAEIISVAKEMAINLTVDPKTTSKYLRTLVSTDDYRLSAKVIGLIGAITCAVAGSLIILSDVTAFWLQTSTKVANGKQPKPKKSKVHAKKSGDSIQSIENYTTK